MRYVIFMLDYNHLSRVGDYSDVVRNSDAFKVMIDHHQEPELECRLLFLILPLVLLSYCLM